MKIENRTIHNVTQGTPEWLALRRDYFTASEAAAMMGVSPYMTRAELLHQKATGLEREVDSGTQSRFDAGHAAEAAARPIAEGIIGDNLYPSTITAIVFDGESAGLPLLASLDGMTMDDSTLFECKLWNEGIVEAIEQNGEPGPAYYWQLEHQLLVTGATSCLFVTSDGTESKWRDCRYESAPKRRAALIAGWKQFAEDLKTYVPQEVIPAAVAAPISELPALDVRISGTVMASNLATWRDGVVARIEAISTDLTTDQDFADADATTKFLREGEDRIDLVKAQAQAQASDIDTVFRAMDDIKAMMRNKRLALEKLVAARKDAIRAEIMQGGRDALAAHVAALNARIGRVLLPAIHADWSSVMKGKKTVASLRNAIDTELARAKIEASAIADKIDANLKRLDREQDHAHLFPDVSALVMKAPEDLEMTIRARIAEHAIAEEKRLAAERERIAAEERAKITHEAQAKAEIAAIAVQQAKNIESAYETAARINLSEINRRLAPIHLTMDGLMQLGIKPVGKDRHGPMYRACDFPAICAAIVQHVHEVMTASERMAA